MSDEEQQEKAAGEMEAAGQDGEEEQDADEYEGDEVDSSDVEDDDTAGSVADNIGHASAPKGWKIIEEQPPLGTDEQL